MSRSVGGNIPGPTLAVTPKSGWTDPAVDDLVIWDTTANMNVDECAEGENPIGRIISVNRAKDVLTIELFTGGMVAVLPYKSGSAPSRGDKIEVSDTANQIKTDNSTGVGKVIAVDRVTGYADVYFE